MKILKQAKKTLKRLVRGDPEKRLLRQYYKRFLRHAFVEGSCKNARQYEACITRLYHTIEKGLAYEDYRAGFGRRNVDMLLREMERYAETYDVEAFFYKTALCALKEYVRKNRECGLEDDELEKKINAMPGTANDKGGAISFQPLSEAELRDAGFDTLLTTRHSIRHFSGASVDLAEVKKAVALAQFTPSACNRQGWSSIVIRDPEVMELVLKNQNGNRGFGHAFDKLILVVGDMRCFNRERELFQVFIDGGMYAENVINALYSRHIAAVPLSASLSIEQERKVRELMRLEDAEVMIMFIGVGQYPDHCRTARSERKPAEIRVI